MTENEQLLQTENQRLREEIRLAYQDCIEISGYPYRESPDQATLLYRLGLIAGRLAKLHAETKP